VRTIDLSCDLGEAASEVEDRVEARLWPLLTSANVACGGHTGDAATMGRAVERARAHGVALGAHPSYPDREHFGRRTMAISARALVDALAGQIAALDEVARGGGWSVTHVKPHGALYNDAHRDRARAEAIVRAVARFRPPLAVVCTASSSLFTAAVEAGLTAIAEAFADRRYRADGSLVPRREPDALILDLDESAAQAVALAERAETICIHSDTPRAVERLEAIRARLAAAGFTPRSCHPAR
jgi:UPF0271 protein